MLTDCFVSPAYSAKRNLHRANFYCAAPEAKHVSIAGDFNEWSPDASPMAKQPDGRWAASLELGHGCHEYVFLVDGKPALDPNASGMVRDGHIGPVSLISVS